MSRIRTELQQRVLLMCVGVCCVHKWVLQIVHRDRRVERLVEGGGGGVKLCFVSVFDEKVQVCAFCAALSFLFCFGYCVAVAQID